MGRSRSRSGAKPQRYPSPVSFTVRPHPRVAVRIYVYSTQAALTAAGHPPKPEHNTAYGPVKRPICIASCRHVTIWRKGRLLPVVAELLFSRTHIGVGTISHEAFHATICAGERLKILALHPQDRRATRVAEETLAIFHGELLRRICNQLLRRQLWQEAT